MLTSIGIDQVYPTQVYPGDQVSPSLSTIWYTWPPETHLVTPVTILADLASDLVLSLRKHTSTYGGRESCSQFFFEWNLTTSICETKRWHWSKQIQCLRKGNRWARNWKDWDRFSTSKPQKEIFTFLISFKKNPTFSKYSTTEEEK